jgi:hypothetical protein
LEVLAILPEVILDVVVDLVVFFVLSPHHLFMALRHSVELHEELLALLDILKPDSFELQIFVLNVVALCKHVYDFAVIAHLYHLSEPLCEGDIVAFHFVGHLGEVL